MRNEEFPNPLAERASGWWTSVVPVNPQAMSDVVAVDNGWQENVTPQGYAADDTVLNPVRWSGTSVEDVVEATGNR